MNDEWPIPRDSSLADLPPSLAANVTAELRDGESVVWLGRPKPERIAISSVRLRQFGWLIATLAVVWLFLVVGKGGPPAENKNEPNLAGFPLNAGALCGLATLLFGVCLMVVAAWWNRQWNKASCYVLTNHRALIWEPTFFGKPVARSFDRAQLGAIRLVENADGTGSLVFMESIAGTKNAHVKVLHGFLHIEEPRKVEDLLRRTLLG